jgi:hypothetical protein
MNLGSTQPLTEMSTRNLPGGKRWPELKVDKLPSSVGRLLRRCGSLDVSHACGPSRPVTGIAFYLEIIGMYKKSSIQFHNNLLDHVFPGHAVF